MKSQEQDHDRLQDELSNVRAELDDARTKLLGLDEEINELTNILKHKAEVVNSSKLEIQKITHELEKSKGITKNLKARLDEIISEHEWVIDGLIVDNIIQQYQISTLMKVKNS